MKEKTFTGYVADVSDGKASILLDIELDDDGEPANDALDVDAYWLGPDGEIEVATFLLGDLCTWDYESRGYRLMQDGRQS